MTIYSLLPVLLVYVLVSLILGSMTNKKEEEGIGALLRRGMGITLALLLCLILVLFLIEEPTLVDKFLDFLASL